MARESDHNATTREKIVRMANQIGTFFQSQPHEEGVAGTAEHLNKFWDPRMRRTFFELMAENEADFLPIVREAATKVRLPDTP